MAMTNWITKQKEYSMENLEEEIELPDVNPEQLNRFQLFTYKIIEEFKNIGTSQAQGALLIETFNFSRTNLGVNERMIISTCPFPNCKFTTTKGERGVKTHYRMMH